MEEGFYWVLYAGKKLIAYYSHEETIDYVTGKKIRGVWHFANADEAVAIDGEAKVLKGPLNPPA